MTGELVLFLLNFLFAGAVLALIAISLGLIFGQLGIVNIAHGEFVMVGAFAMYALRDLPFVASLLAAVAIGAAFGLALEWTVLRRMYDRGFVAPILATFGLGIVLRELAEVIFTSTPRSVTAPIAGSVSMLGVDYPTYRLVMVALAALIVVGVLGILYRTTLGLQVRASIDNPEMSSLLAVSPRLSHALVFAVGTTLAVTAGALVSPEIGVTPTLGLGYLAPAFFAVLIGSPGSITGPVLGALLVALLSTALNRFFTSTVAEALLFGALVALIAIRPEGLKWRAPTWIATRAWIAARSA